ncbi:MAG TPA: response regulator transcription factor [Bacteroidia bacterium]|nr:response regulator transcription factor [Bacteroidia bacterium]
MKILVVEDDPTLGRNIVDALKEQHHDTLLVADGRLAQKSMKEAVYDCIILDINLPGKNGLELCREFRATDQRTPVLLLTAYNQLDDKVEGFAAGADDYLAKPFYMKELLMRLQALSKRSLRTGHKQDPEIIKEGDLEIHTARKKVIHKGQEITLTPREYGILLKLLSHPGEVVSKRELIRDVWGTSVEVNTNTVEVYINFLRNKLDKPFQTQSIKTKAGYGYYFDPS